MPTYRAMAYATSLDSLQELTNAFIAGAPLNLAVIDAFILYVCKSKYIKLSNKDLSKLHQK